MEPSAVDRRKDYAIAAATILVVLGGLAYFASTEQEEPAQHAVTLDSAGQKKEATLVTDSAQSAAESPPLTHAPQKFAVERLKGRAFLLQQSFNPRPGDAAKVIASLLPLAQQGDEVAAFEIYRKISACRSEWEAAIRSAPSTERENLIPRDCQSIPVNQWRVYSARWLEASAEKGFLPAQLMYGVDPTSIVGSGPELIADPEAVAAYRRNAMGYMHRAALTGSVDALSMLAGAYANGILTKRDPVLAYAYFHAGTLATGRSDSMHDLMRQRYETELTRSEVQRATQQGRSIYEECCSP
ncbi:hypothetical protein [Lysobacter sp.]|uniref:hypothetical protein n=1 Tax=Lysobacter sp. TaxID=72226 RepID=UPI002D58E0B7|nr:hypothetical protein [Lysobacter sp.]HZX77315.1 hypothetical protein [Lysobacter sp.]